MELTDEVIYTGEEFDFYGRASVADCESLDDLWKDADWAKL